MFAQLIMHLSISVGCWLMWLLECFDQCSSDTTRHPLYEVAVRYHPTPSILVCMPDIVKCFEMCCICRAIWVGDYGQSHRGPDQENAEDQEVAARVAGTQLWDFSLHRSTLEPRCWPWIDEQGESCTPNSNEVLSHSVHNSRWYILTYLCSTAVDHSPYCYL